MQMLEMFSLKGKCALITGASRGLGYAIAEALASAGAQTILHGRDRAALDRARAAFAQRGWACSIIIGEMTDESGVRSMARRLLAQHGCIDILVNNAGGNIRKGLLQASSADWREVLEMDLTACFTLTQEVAPKMIEAGWGRIINMGSVMSVVSRAGIPAYAAAKHGVAGLTRALAAELGSKGVTVNAICPGFFLTEANEVHLQNPKFTNWVQERTPLGRWGDPKEVGCAAIFLASDAGSYVNGHLLMVDGGLTASM
jgi:gluconate 5-dehydrogenase